jgi:predicted acetyltransferase
MAVSIRPISEDEIEDAQMLLAEAFADHGARSRPEDAVQAFRRGFAVENTVATFVDGVLATFVQWRPVDAWLWDGPANLASAGPGATRPTFRRGGLHTRSLALLFDQMRRAGVPLTVIESPVVGWHRHNGWEISSAALDYRLDPRVDRVPKPAAGRPWLADEGAVAALQALHRRWGARHPLTICRTDAWWAERLKRAGGGPSDVYLWVEDDEQATGYVVYRVVRDAGGAMVLEVEELVHETPSAFLGLLGLVLSHNIATAVTWSAPVDDPLLAVIAEPGHVTVRWAYDKLARVVDVPAALALRPTSAEGTVLVVEVRDDLASWNQGTWRLGAADGRITAVPTDAVPEARLDVRWLAPLMFGHVTPATVLIAGGLAADDDDALARLRSLFDARPPPYCADHW